LRNYRVYEDLDLELPPGLIGVYGANGSGKSTLIEAIRFSLYGRGRTSNDEIRTSGVNADCVAEVQFEHEGHLYVVRRTISGVNSTVKAQARKDGRLAMDQYTRARDLLPDVEKAKVELAEAEAAAATAVEAETASAKQLAEAEKVHTAARKAHDALVVTRNEYDRIVAE